MLKKGIKTIENWGFGACRIKFGAFVDGFHDDKISLRRKKSRAHAHISAEKLYFRSPKAPKGHTKPMQIIRRYPLSLLCIALIWVLCFCHPPQTSMDGVPGIDKLAHVVMYLGTCGIMWWEYLRHHKALRLRHAVLWLIVMPVLMSGVIELLQEFATVHRGGDWIDFAANTCGVVLGALFGRYVVWPYRKRQARETKE